jgi:hypothetical protein
MSWYSGVGEEKGGITAQANDCDTVERVTDSAMQEKTFGAE